MEQLHLPFEVEPDEPFAELGTRLVTEAEKLREALEDYNIAFQAALRDAEEIAGCSLEDWPDETVLEYLRLFLRLQNEKSGSTIEA